MKNRYEDTDIIVNENNKKSYSTTIYSYINESEQDIIYTTKEGDRLDLLAKKFYSDATLWWVIARKNLLNCTFYLKPGIQLIIPEKTLSNFIFPNEE